MPNFYLVAGMSGAGKTTFAKQYSKFNDCTYLSPDLFYTAINGDETIHNNKFEIWHALFRAIQTAYLQDNDVVVDTNALTYFNRVQFLEWFPGFEHHLIWVDAPFELCLKNNRARRRQIPKAEMIRKFERIEEPSAEEDSRWKTFIKVKNHNNVLEIDGVCVSAGEENFGW